MSDKMREKHWREWAIEGMPKDKQRLADATWQAGYQAALASQPAQGEAVAEVYRYGRSSRGKEWHGILFYDEGIDLPTGTKLYTDPPARAVPDDLAYIAGALAMREKIARCLALNPRKAIYETAEHVRKYIGPPSVDEAKQWAEKAAAAPEVKP